MEAKSLLIIIIISRTSFSEAPRTTEPEPKEPGDFAVSSSPSLPPVSVLEEFTP